MLEQSKHEKQNKSQQIMTKFKVNIVRINYLAQWTAIFCLAPALNACETERMFTTKYTLRQFFGEIPKANTTVFIHLFRTQTSMQRLNGQNPSVKNYPRHWEQIARGLMWFEIESFDEEFIKYEQLFRTQSPKW